MNKRLKAWIRENIPPSIKKFVSYSEEVEYGCISFSQYGEDMVLRNFFRGKTDGFYVDIGAHEPIRYSNTYFFYKLGWSGIVVDPLPGALANFEEKRPRDRALGIGISDESGSLEYYCFRQPLYNTFSVEHAKLVESPENPLIEVIRISVRRLDEVLEEYLPKERKLDFMSVDAEGYDLHILRSNDWTKFRPGILVIENLGIDMANFQNDEICQFLKGKDYELAGFTHKSLFFATGKRP